MKDTRRNHSATADGLKRSDIADFIREAASHFVRQTNDPAELMANIYTSLRMSVMGNSMGFAGLARNTFALADLIGLTGIADTAIRTNETKGKDYAPGTDILANFYRVAQVTGVDALVVWGVYVTKHVEALNAYVTTGKLESEPIDSRIVDVIVYAALGYYINEREQGKGVTE